MKHHLREGECKAGFADKEPGTAVCVADGGEDFSGNAQADDPRYAVLTAGLLPPCSTFERATAQVVLDEGISPRVASPCINDPKHRSGVSASQPAR